MADVKVKYVPGKWRITHDGGTFFYARKVGGDGETRMFQKVDVEKVYYNKRLMD